MRIRLDSLSKSYGDFALREIDCDIPDGSVVALIGVNGAGKTTLLRCMAGLAQPTHGRILYDGQEFTRHRLDLRRRLMYLADVPLVFPDMSAIQWIGLSLRLYEVERPGLDECVVAWLSDLGVASISHKPMSTLSRGQLYKAALAALLAVQPEVWLLDEPFASGMDPTGISILKRSIGVAAEAGRTVVFSTQLLEIAETVADHVAILDSGRLVAMEPVGALGQGGQEHLEALFMKLRESA